MNDTHRSTPSFGKLIDATRHAFRMPARPEQVGRLTPEVRDALNTQTTLPNSAASVESVVTPARRFLAVTCDHDQDALDVVTVNGREFVPAIQASESGKSGDRAPIDEFAGGYAFAPRNDAVRAENQDASAREALARVSDSVEASLERFGEACRDSIRFAELERERDTARSALELEGLRSDALEIERDTARDLAGMYREALVDVRERIEPHLLTYTMTVIDAALDAGKLAIATPDGVKEAAHYAAVGALKEEGEGEDGPTPEAQAEAFQAITAEPRPSAVAIKAALERGDEIIRKVLRWTPVIHSETPYRPSSPECATIGLDLRAMLGMLDRLGIHCLALEIERDGLAAQLDRIADQAKPIDGTDLAELVQEARVWLDRNPKSSTPSRAATDIMERLVAAVNDQGRRLREAETVEHTPTAALLKESADLVELHWRGKMDFGPGATAELVACLSRTRWALIQAMNTGTEAAALVAEAFPSVRLVNDWATWTDSSLYAYADGILRKVLPDAPARDAIVDALAEIRKVARGRLRDAGFTIPPSYTDEQRQQAADALRKHWPGMTTVNNWRPSVDLVAKALGMVPPQ